MLPFRTIPTTNRRLRRLAACAFAITLIATFFAPAAWGAAPDQPDAPTVVARDREIRVSFVAPLNDGGSAISGYTATCTAIDDPLDTHSTPSSDPTVLSLDVAGITNGVSYTCTVLATNADGDSPSSQPSATVVPAPGTVPGPPGQPPVAATSATQITVTVDPLDDGGSTITGYTATCTSSNGGNAGTNTAASPSIIVGGLSTGLTYGCTVFATNANGDGPPSPASVSIVVKSVPDAPSLAIVTPGSGQISVTFVPLFPPNDGGSPILSYTANCTSSDGGNAGSATSPADADPLRVVVTGLTSGRTYTCTVFATNEVGAGPPSPPSSETTPFGAETTPAAPQAPTLTPGSGSITLRFFEPNSGGSPITGYTAKCASSTGGGTGTKTGPGSPLVVGGLSIGHTYTCTVFATNEVGDGAPSPPSLPTTLTVTSVPGAPPKPAATAGDARITVKFSAPSNGGSPITSYATLCTSSNSGVPVSKVTTGSPAVVAGVTNGRTYSCRVRAHNALGDGPWSALSANVVPIKLSKGFRLVAGDGGVFTFGASRSFGSAAGVSRSTVLGIAATPSGNGYWLVAADGGIFSFGDAHFYGSTGGMRLTRPVVGMTSTPSGRGYWLVASDGGIFAFGDAHFYGSTGAIRLTQPIVGMTATPTGRGYWLIASDGGLFAFGDAHFFGSAAGRTGAAVGMASSATGRGYWIAAANGAVFAFGDARPLGSVPAAKLRLPVVGITSTLTGKGYWVAAGDGGVFAFGDAPFFGWPGPLVLARTIRGISR